MDNVVEAIKKELKPLKKRVKILEDTLVQLGESRNPGPPRPDIQEREDNVWAAIVAHGTGPFTANKVCKDAGYSSTVGYPGLKRLMSKGLVVDTTPERGHHKSYALTAKGAALAGIKDETEEKLATPKPRKKVISEGRKKVSQPAKRNVNRPKATSKVRYLPGTDIPEGSRLAEVYNFLLETQTFTIKQVAHTFNTTEANIGQKFRVLREKLGKDVHIVKTQGNAKAGESNVYRSLLYQPKRETRLNLNTGEAELGRQRNA
jgi:hypothetical protein